MPSRRILCCLLSSNTVMVSPSAILTTLASKECGGSVPVAGQENRSVATRVRIRMEHSPSEPAGLTDVVYRKQDQNAQQRDGKDREQHLDRGNCSWLVRVEWNGIT